MNNIKNSTRRGYTVSLRLLCCSVFVRFDFSAFVYLFVSFFFSLKYQNCMRYFIYVAVLFHSTRTVPAFPSSGVQREFKLNRYQEESVKTVHCNAKDSNISNWLPEFSCSSRVSSGGTVRLSL